ncbi:MAG: AAA family ATPase, partial [Nitrososphaerota archaeon]
MFIYHTSDIHIRPGVYDDIKFTWNEMIEKMTEGILVIAGDLFERKGHFVAEDISCYCELIDAVPKNIPIIIIPGNHDYNRGNLDAISPIKLAANRRDDIYYFPKSGIYNIKNYPFDFHILSPMDGIIPPITNKKKLKIAIIHEQIGRLTINQLSLYDLVLAGDSHEVHFLTDKIAYCGSLIQKTANESLEHGFIKWDLSNLKGEFIPLPQNNVILSLHFKHNKLEEFPPGIFNKVKRIDFHHEKCSIEYVNKTFHELQEKYKCPIRKIDHNKIIQNEPLPEDTSSEQLRLLQENLPEDIRDVILERHKQEIKILPSRNKWRLNYLQWDNFLCYGSENHIIFTELSGLYLLSGPNRIGKSTILDILCFTLYGEPIRGNISELIRKGESSLFVACGFTIGNKNYIISRRRGKSRDTYDELRFSEENELPHVITGVNNIREYIISLLGPLDQFLAVNIAIQDRILNDNLATYFENYLGLDSLQKIYDTVRGELTALNSNIKRINQDLVKKEKLNRVSLVSELRNIEISLKDFEDRIQELNNRIQRKQNEICQLKLVLVPCEKVREEEEIQKELSKIPEINITDEELSLLVSDPKNIGTNKEERIKELQSLPSNLPDIEEVRERLKNYYGYEKRKTNIPFENLLNGEFKEVSKTREEINKELESISEFQIIQTEYKVDKVSKSQLKELEEKIKKLESIPQIKSRHTSYSEEEIIKLSENIKDTI